VTWVWAPNVESLWDWAPMDNYYPGDEYVDWVGMDGYGYNAANWAHDRSKTFELTFSSTYDILKAHNKPIMVAEIAAGEDSSDANFKPDWITDAFAKMQNQYPLIKAYTWFDYNKEEDWRFNSSNASLSAYKTSIQNQYFIGR
jgi:beta-mannanase